MKTTLNLLKISFALCFVIGCVAKAPEKIQYEQKDEKPPLAAKILGQEVDMNDLLEGSALEHFQIQEKEYRFKKERLDRLVRAKVLETEAKKLKINADELINKHILKGPIKVSASEVDQFIKEKNIDKNQVDGTARKQMEDFLIAQKREKKITDYLAKLTSQAPVEVYFKRPVFNLPKEQIARPTEGYTNAKIKMIEVIDYQCEACRLVTSKIEQLRKNNSRDIEVSYLYFPGEGRTEGRLSAEAAVCGFRQKPEAFWGFHRALMALKKAPEQSEILALAGKHGLDKAKLEECLNKKIGAADLRQHFEFANKLGVRASPLIILNGEVLVPDTPMADMQSKIKE